MSNEFYDSLAPYYHNIFPLSNMKVEAINKLISQNSIQKVLDIGCAIGEFAVAISQNVDKVNGFDLDKNMIEIAKSSINTNDTNVQFDVGDMLELDCMYETTFGLVTCFGNTLVHLTNEQVTNVFEQIFEILGEQGIFVGQIINYDYVYTKPVESLPLIDNKVIRFERTYDLLDEKKLLFNTRLIIKESNRVLENQIPLYPIRKVDMEKQLLRAGFQDIKFYKNYNLDTFEGNHLPLIFVAKK